MAVAEVLLNDNNRRSLGVSDIVGVPSVEKKALSLLPEECYNEQVQEEIKKIEENNPELNYVRIALLATQGYTNAYIAEQLGVSEFAIAEIKRSSEYSAAVELLVRQVQGYAKAVLATIVPRAIDNLIELMFTSKSEKIRLQATIQVLDRAGIKTADEVVVNRDNKQSQFKNMTVEELKRLIALGGEEIINVSEVQEIDGERYTEEKLGTCGEGETGAFEAESMG